MLGLTKASTEEESKLGLQPLPQVQLSTWAAPSYHQEGNTGIQWKLKWDVPYKFQACHKKKKIPTNNCNYLPCETAGCIWKWGGSRDGHPISDLRDEFRSEEKEKGIRPPHCPTSPEAPAKWTPAAIPSPFLEDRAELMHTTQCEMDFGDGEDIILLPNLLKVPRGLWTTPILETDHRFSRVLTSRHWLRATEDSGRAGSPPGLASFPALPASPLSTCEVDMLYIGTSKNESLTLPGRGYNWGSSLCVHLQTTSCWCVDEICPPHFPVTQWETGELSWGWLSLLSP